MPVVPDQMVKILLSVHDGEPYLDNLIQSVRDQDYRHWSLLVADDGSSDVSMDIVARHAAVDSRIVVVASRPPGAVVGPARSFMELLALVGDDDLFAFCDQDDVWFPHKLSWTLDALEALRPCSGIAAVATDAIATDSRLSQIAPSALASHGVGRDVTLGRLFVNNVAIGATMAGTGRLALVACQMGEHLEVRMHDWWCALVAAYGGEFEVLSVPTMYWRRHGSTVTGMRPQTVGARVDRRVDSVGWASEAARELIVQLEPVDDRAHRVAAAMAEVVVDTMSPVDIVRLRRHGIRAWSLRHDVNLIGASCVRWLKSEFVNP
jgi:rhamnosyltransferase